MDELKEFIRTHREEFEDSEPVEGHRERFLGKLENKNDASPMTLFWRVAAAIIILVVLGLSVLVPGFNSPGDIHYGAMTLGDVSDEMAGVELYYQSRLEEEYNKIDDLSESDPLVRSYLDELDTLNADYKKLEKSLYESGGHEKVVLAMIENFRMRLDLMEKLEQKKNETLKSDSI